MNLQIIIVAAVLTRILSNPIANVFQKQLTIRQHPLFVNLVSYTLLSLLSLFLIAGYPVHTLNAQFWIYSILGGIAGALGNGFIIKALELGDLSVLGPINAYKSIVGIIFAFILIGEIPNAWGFAGVALIITGSYFVLNTGTQSFSWALFKQPAIKYRILALVLTGIQAVLDKKVIQNSNLTLAFAGWCIFGAFFSYLFFLTTSIHVKQEARKIDKDTFWRYIALAASIGVMVATTNYTFSHMPVGEALALFQISILVSVFLGYRVFNEKGLLKKLLGSIIMIIGSLLIILFK